MLICPDKKYIFFKPMKCAGSSVEHSLYTQVGEAGLCTGSETAPGKVEYLGRNNLFVEDGHVAKRFLQHTPPWLFYTRIGDPSIYDDYMKITVVRNPWDALVSYYWWCISRWELAGEEILPHGVIEPDDDSGTVMLKFESTITAPSTYDDDIIAHEIGLRDEIASPFILFHKLQNGFVDARIDRYLRYEDLTHDFNDLCRDIGYGEIELKKHKSGFRKDRKRHYREYYNDWMRDIVARKFAGYIKKFGYKF